MSDDEEVGRDGDARSEWTDEWLDARAAEAGVSPDTLLDRFAAAFRAAEEGEVPRFVRESALEDLDRAVADLDDRVADLDADLDHKIEDVRERVIQVKREADAKAPADHEHPAIAARVETAAETAADARAAALEAADDVSALDARVDEGFSNYEEILEYLVEAVDDVESKETRLASAILAMRETVQGMREREGRRMAADRLREQANTHGVRSADCADCDATLDVALLTDARCPHCSATFASVEPPRGFFGSPTLTVGDRPALEAGTTPDESDGAIADIAADGDGRESVLAALQSSDDATASDDRPAAGQPSREGAADE